MILCNQNKWVGVAPQEGIVDRRIIGRGKHWRGETPTTFRDFTFPFRRKAFDEGIKST